MSLRFQRFMYPVTAVFIFVVLEIANIWLGEQMAGVAGYLVGINADWFWLNVEYDLGFLNSYGAEEIYVYYLQILTVSYAMLVLSIPGSVGSWSAFMAHNEKKGQLTDLSSRMKLVLVCLFSLAVVYAMFFVMSADPGRITRAAIFITPMRAFWYPLVLWEIFGFCVIGLLLQSLFQITYFALVKKAERTA